jgi:hypothetical protein
MRSDRREFPVQSVLFVVLHGKNEYSPIISIITSVLCSLIVWMFHSRVTFVSSNVANLVSRQLVTVNVSRYSVESSL